MIDSPAMSYLLKTHTSSLFTGQDGPSCFQLCTSGTRFSLPLGLNFHMQVNHVFIQTSKFTGFIIVHIMVKCVILTN